MGAADGARGPAGQRQALLRAIETVSGDLALEVVLRDLAEAAVQLTGARCGMLTVQGPDGGFEQAVTVGLPAARLGARIGTEVGAGAGAGDGVGLIGTGRLAELALEVIANPKPVRLDRGAGDGALSRDGSSPGNAAPLEDGPFLGVPLQGRDDVVGSLCLAGGTRDAFDDEDEQLAAVLARAAGTAVQDARRQAESHAQQRWLAASVQIGAHLLGADVGDPLITIASHAFELADADLVTLGLLYGDRSSLEIRVALGDSAADLIGQQYAVVDGTLAKQCLENGGALRVANAPSDYPRLTGLPDSVHLGPVMVLAVGRDEDTLGFLSIARTPGRPGFTETDLAMAAGFANHASVALELAETRAAAQRTTLLEDRDRIARDLHDHVIQELFAIGLSLETVAAQLGRTAAAEHIQQRVEDIDRTIARIRTSIFELRGPFDAIPDGLRARIVEIATDLVPALGFVPRVEFAGLVDFGVDADLADDVGAVVREGLTNVAKHARAQSASVSIRVDSDGVAVELVDDGIGPAGATRSSGVSNLRARAAIRGGSFEIRGGPHGGTVVSWRVPG